MFERLVMLKRLSTVLHCITAVITQLVDSFCT